MSEKRLPSGLVAAGVPIAGLSIMFALRMVWEQTIWTWQRGPQMVGFSLMHSGLGLLVVLALWGGLIWVVLMLMFAAIRRTTGGGLAISVVVVYGLAWALLSVPYGQWQRLFIERLAHGIHAAEFMQEAAARGDLRTVEAFLENGVAVGARDRRGATALHAAAVGGQVAVAEVLVSKGADVNAVDRYGDSPLESAESMNRADVARFLRARGAKLIRGSPEQRDRATSEIVRESSEELEKLLPKGFR